MTIKLHFIDCFFAGYFNSIQNLKLQNFEILTQQLFLLASDNAFVLARLTTARLLKDHSQTTYAQIIQFFDPCLFFCTHFSKTVGPLKQ